jgi:hypothetical protein
VCGAKLPVAEAGAKSLELERALETVVRTEEKPVVETTVIETSDVIFWLENVPLSVYMLPLEFHRD